MLRSGRAWLVLAFAVVVVTAAGCGSKGEARILDVQPRIGNTTGEQPIKILGENFRTDIGYTVFFGTKRSQNVTIFDSGTLVAVTPSRDTPGPVEITIRADDGNAWKIAGGFSYQEPPRAPASGDTTGAPVKGRY